MLGVTSHERDRLLRWLPDETCLRRGERLLSEVSFPEWVDKSGLFLSKAAVRFQG